jgi:hypothetical protein
MSRSSYIVLKRFDVEEYAGIYCHFDGQLGHNGKILLKNYTTYEDVIQLVRLGNISVLDSTLDTCIAYHRDRREEWVDHAPRLAQSLEQYKTQYVYLFKENGWHVKMSMVNDFIAEIWNGELIKLTDAIERMHSCRRDTVPVI